MIHAAYIKEKAAEQAEIDKLRAEFLAKGGQITTLPAGASSLGEHLVSVDFDQTYDPKGRVNAYSGATQMSFI